MLTWANEKGKELNGELRSQNLIKSDFILQKINVKLYSYIKTIHFTKNIIMLKN